MSTYDVNRTWSDQYLPQVKSIISEHLISVAPDALDQKQATDLLTLDAKDRRIAVRVRRPGYGERYPYDFTLRSGLPSGAKTELAKIVEGYGDWLMYAHADAHGGLAGWWLIDLRAFRAALIRRGQHGICMGEHVNHDGTRFCWFDVRSFPSDPPLVVSASQPLLI